MKDIIDKNKEKQLYDVGSMGILAGGYSGIMLFCSSFNIIELILGILGISLGVLLILQWKEPYSHREKYIKDLKYLLIAVYVVFILIFIKSPQPVPGKLLVLSIALLINSAVIFIIYKVEKSFTK